MLEGILKHLIVTQELAKLFGVYEHLLLGAFWPHPHFCKLYLTQVCHLQKASTTDIWQTEET